MPDNDALRSRWALGHFKFRELAPAAAIMGGTAVLFATALGLLAGLSFLTPIPGAARSAIFLAAGAEAACLLYAAFIEVDRLAIRTLTLANPKVVGEGVRILHLSDTHVRRWSRLEESVIRESSKLKPDLILMSGDYTASSHRTEDAHRLLRELARIAPVLACRGNNDFRPPPMSELFDGTGARLLKNETVELTIRDTVVAVTGIDPGHEEKLLSAPPDPKRLSLCLYHYPDLIPRLDEVPFDLMLCGHTHGGQVRFPFWGAVVSMSRAGTRYALGLFEDGGKYAYITSGVGSESYGLIPFRFLCPPELTLITLKHPDLRQRAS